jgi:predicted nucleotidyltransferase
VSATAIHKSLNGLARPGLIIVLKDKETKRLSISLNRVNPRVRNLKRAENLRSLYESGLPAHLSENLLGATIIIFGSYSFGEDSRSSDIDIAIVGYENKQLELRMFKRILEHRISCNFYGSWLDIHKNLMNGIVLHGGFRL